MMIPDGRQQRALSQLDPDVADYLRAALLDEDAINRRRYGTAGDVGAGRAQILEELLELVDGATAPPIN